MNLHQKLLEIQKTVAYLKKDNKGFQYQYVSSSQTVAKVRDKMDELGVLLIPRVTSYRVERAESENDRGKMSVQYFTEIAMDMEWVNVEEPADKLICPWYAQGKDSGEKGVGKALTYGEKYFLLKFFHIATDQDDPDAFQEKRVEAGKRGTRPTVVPLAPPPSEPLQAMNSGRPVPLNPWVGKLVSIGEAVSGSTNGKPWTYWDIETQEMNLVTFDKGIAEVAAIAIQENNDVEMIWKLKRSAKTGEERCLAENIMILETMDREFQRKVG